MKLMYTWLWLERIHQDVASLPFALVVSSLVVFNWKEASHTVTYSFVNGGISDSEHADETKI